MASINSLEYYIAGSSGASAVVGSSGTTTRIVRFEIIIDAGESGSILDLRIAGGDISGSVDEGELVALLSQDATAYIDVFGNDITSGYLAKANITKPASTLGFVYDYATTINYNFTPGTYYVFFVPTTVSVGQAYAHTGYREISLSGKLTYTVSFDANGGDTTPTAITVEEGQAITLPTISRDNYTFLGWAESNTATTGLKGSYTPTGSILLFAIWSEKLGSYMYYNNNGNAIKCEVYYNNNGNAVKCEVYYNNNGNAVKT